LRERGAPTLAGLHRKLNRARPHRSGEPKRELARRKFSKNENRAGDRDNNTNRNQGYEHKKKNLRFGTNTKQDAN
jgi:hypothetical protein